jgi:adenylosuccinate synthase
MATSYTVDGRKQTAVPGNINAFARLQPVYESLAGWDEDIRQVRSFEELPVKARDYIRRIEEFTRTPAYIVSVGPGREETLLLRNPFESDDR